MIIFIKSYHLILDQISIWQLHTHTHIIVFLFNPIWTFSRWWWILSFFWFNGHFGLGNICLSQNRIWKTFLWECTFHVLFGGSPCLSMLKWLSLLMDVNVLLLTRNPFHSNVLLWYPVCSYNYLWKFCALYIPFFPSQVQLTVTPKVEGSLRIVGIKWKLCSVVGYYNLESHLRNKKTARGRRKAKHSPGNDLKFVVIKVQANNLSPHFVLPVQFAL